MTPPDSQEEPERAPSSDWKAIEADPEFRKLVRAKARFILPATLFFILYYFALPILVGYMPELMEMTVVGNINLAYLFALSQFFMAWFLMALYLRAASRFDRMAAEIVEKVNRLS